MEDLQSQLDGLQTCNRLLQKAVGTDLKMVNKKLGTGQCQQVTGECRMVSERLSWDTCTAEEATVATE